MKIIEILKAEKAFSFKVFPPKTDLGKKITEGKLVYSACELERKVEPFLRRPGQCE